MGEGRGVTKQNKTISGLSLGSIYLSLTTIEPCSLVLLIFASQNTIEEIYITA